MPGESFKQHETAKRDAHGWNLRDKPEKYQGRRRAAMKAVNPAFGDETKNNIESASPVVYLAIEHIQGIGDSVIAASMSFKQVVQAVQNFAEKIEGAVYPERVYLPSAGPVRMRTDEGNLTPYRVDPVSLE